MKSAMLGLALSLAGVATVHAAGPYLADRPHDFLGQSIGPGHCVDYVKAAAGVPNTHSGQTLICGARPVSRSKRLVLDLSLA